MPGFRLIIKAVSHLLLCLLATVAAAQNSDSPPRVPAPKDPYETQCAMKDWGGFLAPRDQTLEHIETTDTRNGQIPAFRLDPLVGLFAKVFVFLPDNRTCYSEGFSIDSYDFTNASHEGPGRLYHGDIYRKDTHSTYGFFEEPPEYEAAKTIALDVLQ
ncbi:MAG: hypothetical protein ACI8R4_000833 [Paracoccaceae bacterium]|jgi:hypothetical protein